MYFGVDGVPVSTIITLTVYPMSLETLHILSFHTLSLDFNYCYYTLVGMHQECPFIYAVCYSFRVVSALVLIT